MWKALYCAVISWDSSMNGGCYRLESLIATFDQNVATRKLFNFELLFYSKHAPRIPKQITDFIFEGSVFSRCKTTENKKPQIILY